MHKFCTDFLINRVTQTLNLVVELLRKKIEKSGSVFESYHWFSRLSFPAEN